MWGGRPWGVGEEGLVLDRWDGHTFRPRHLCPQQKKCPQKSDSVGLINQPPSPKSMQQGGAIGAGE